MKIFLGIDKAINLDIETIKRAFKWGTFSSLKWLHGLVHNSHRLWKNNLFNGIFFYGLTVLQKLNPYYFKSAHQPIYSKVDLNRSVDAEKLIDSEEKINVLMFGPCLSEQGGMGAVQNHIVNNTWTQLNIKHITIWNGKTSSLTLFSRALAIFLFQLLKNQVDLVHLHVSERGSVLRNSILALIAFTFSKPVIMHTHGSEFHIFYDNLPWIVQKLINKIWQSCSYIIALSKSWRNTYIEKCALDSEQVLVKYNPVAVPKDQVSRIKSDKITFVFLGKITQRKGIFDLLIAIARLPSDLQRKAEFIIAGSGETEKAIAMAKELQIDSLVSFPGWITSKERDRLLERADVFLLPSYNEGLPMALLEAMSWQLPVITTSVGGIPEIIVDNVTGLLMEPGDIEHLTSSIQNLVNCESLRLKLGNAAYQKALPLDVDNYVRELSDLYSSILLKSGKNNTIV
ncbi:MAG: glycosyltransferase family 4 protein [Cyanobacteria bacterium J06621_8]